MLGHLQLNNYYTHYYIVTLAMLLLIQDAPVAKAAPVAMMNEGVLTVKMSQIDISYNNYDGFTTAGDEAENYADAAAAAEQTPIQAPPTDPASIGAYTPVTPIPPINPTLAAPPTPSASSGPSSQQDYITEQPNNNWPTLRAPPTVVSG